MPPTPLQEREALGSVSSNVPPPELPADFVTEIDDGLPLELNASSKTGYKCVQEVKGHFTVNPGPSFKARVRKYFQGKKYATALDAASALARKAKETDDALARVNAAKQRKAQ